MTKFIEVEAFVDGKKVKEALNINHISSIINRNENDDILCSIVMTNGDIVKVYDKNYFGIINNLELIK